MWHQQQGTFSNALKTSIVMENIHMIVLALNPNAQKPFLLPGEHACFLTRNVFIGRHPDKFKEINYYLMVRIGDSSEAGKGINYF